MKSLIIFALAALHAGCAVSDAADRVFERDEQTSVDQAEGFQGVVRSAGDFSLTPDDASRYGLIGALHAGKMVLLRIGPLATATGDQRAEIVHFGSYRVVDGELKTVRHFGCSADLGLPRDFYFEVQASGDVFELRERSVRKLVMPPIALSLQSAGSLASSPLTPTVEADKIGCADAARNATAQGYIADIVTTLTL